MNIKPCVGQKGILTLKGHPKNGVNCIVMCITPGEHALGDVTCLYLDTYTNFYLQFDEFWNYFKPVEG